VRPISGKDLGCLLEQAGWTLKRIKGSHHIYGKAGERKILTVPVHGNQTLKPGLALRLAKDANVFW